MNACVIGCIFGKEFQRVYPAVKNYDAYFFTNNQEMKPTLEEAGWKYIFIDKPMSDDIAVSSLQSKYIKFLQFLKNDEFSFFNKYDRIVYADHKLDLKDEHVEYLLERIGDSDILVRDHNRERKSIWEEVEAAKRQERYLRFMPQTISAIA